MHDQPYVEHHGVLGQRWGVRRWQNSDGSLTTAGRIHYGIGSERGKMGEKAQEFRTIATNTKADINKKVQEFRTIATNTKADVNKKAQEFRTIATNTKADVNKKAQEFLRSDAARILTSPAATWAINVALYSAPISTRDKMIISIALNSVRKMSIDALSDPEYVNEILKNNNPNNTPKNN